MPKQRSHQLLSDAPSDQPRKQMKVAPDSTSSSNERARSCGINSLSADLLSDCLSFIGVGHYRYIAATCHSFRSTYQSLLTRMQRQNLLPKKRKKWYDEHEKSLWKTEYRSAVSSLPCATLYIEESLADWDEEGALEIATYSAQYGRLDMVEWVCQSYGLDLNQKDEQGFLYSARLFHSAAEGDQIHILKYLIKHKFTWGEHGNYVMVGAAAGGSLDSMKYLRCMCCPLESSSDWYGQVVEEAATGGHRPMLDYLRWTVKEFDEDDCCLLAMEGNLDLLECLHEEGCPLHDRTSYHAAKNGHLGVLRFAHENGCPLTERVHEAAIESGQIDVLSYVHRRGCPQARNACTIAAKTGRMDVLKFLHEEGVSDWDAATFAKAVYYGEVNMLTFLHELGCPWNLEACNTAAHRGHVEILKFLKNIGCPWDESTFADAVRSGDAEVIKFLHESGCPSGSDLCQLAAEEGNVEALEYLHSHGHGWESKSIIESAALRGQLNVIRFLQKNGCLLSSKVFTNAAKRGGFRAVKYLWEQGCPYDSTTSTFTEVAKERPDMKVVKYLRKQGFPWDSSTFASAAGGGNLKLLQYLHKNKCPCDFSASDNAAKSLCQCEKEGFSEIFAKMYLEVLRYLLDNGLVRNPVSAASDGWIRVVCMDEEVGYDFCNAFTGKLGKMMAAQTSELSELA